MKEEPRRRAFLCHDSRPLPGGPAGKAAGSAHSRLLRRGQPPRGTPCDCDKSAKFGECAEKKDGQAVNTLENLSKIVPNIFSISRNILSWSCAEVRKSCRSQNAPK